MKFSKTPPSQSINGTLNASELEAENDADAEELTHTKQQLGGTKPSGSKLLGLPWDQEQDVFRDVSNVEEDSSMTKKSILSQPLSSDH